MDPYIDSIINNMSEELSKHTGITFEQAKYIIDTSKIVNCNNFKDWLNDIDKIVKLDTIDG